MTSEHENPGLNRGPVDSAGLTPQQLQQVRDEVIRVLRLFGVTAERSIGYYTDHIDHCALTAIKDTAESAARVMRDPEHPFNAPADEVCPACGHLVRRHTEVPSRYPGQTTCSGCLGCDDRDPADNPFAPLDPDCHHAFATDEGITRCQKCEGIKTNG